MAIVKPGKLGGLGKLVNSDLKGTGTAAFTPESGSFKGEKSSAARIVP